MRLMYVFDYRETSGHLCRMPEAIARFITRHIAYLNYAPTDKGL